MAKLDFDERVALLQEKMIDILGFVMSGDDADDFLAWCRTHSVEPNPEMAQFYVDMTDERTMLQQEDTTDDTAIQD